MNLKHLLSFIFIIFSFHVLYPQVELSSKPLDLKKGQGFYTSIAAPDAQNSQLVVFAADKENVKALRYNSALFYTDSLTSKRPDDKYEFIGGYSFEGPKATHVYWTSYDYTHIQAIGFEFNAKTTSSLFFELPLKDENIVTTFSDNNSFYIITLPDEKESDTKLKFYILNEGKYETRVADFSAMTFFNTDNKKLNLKRLLEDNGMQKIEAKSFTGLQEASQKVKFYIEDGIMILTMDHNPTATQVLTIDLNNFTVVEKAVPQAKFDESDSNSYLHNGKLYQLKLNKEQLSLTAADIVTGEVIKSYIAASTDSISFRNSELLSCTGNQRPKFLKDTKKFLQRASNSNVAVSVYETPDDLLVTVGGVRSVLTAGDAVLGAAVIAAGGSEDLFDPNTMQFIYFESLFNKDFEHTTFEPGRLAADYLSEFMSKEKNIMLESVFPFHDYLVLGYYDSKEKQYILRKFRDDDF